MMGILSRHREQRQSARALAGQWLEGYTEAQKDVLAILGSASDVPLEERLRAWATS